MTAPVDRPGGWLDGVGWVAYMHQLHPDTRVWHTHTTEDDGAPVSFLVGMGVGTHRLMVVKVWPDGSIPLLPDVG